jgi:thiol-disulfide isomerase/thioredoxin
MKLPRLLFTASSLCALLALPEASPAQDLAGVVAGLSKRFKQLDTDGDGKLSVEETKSVAVWLKGADADGDGFITPDEARNHFRAHLAELLEAKKGVAPTDASQVDEKAPPSYQPSDSPREEATRVKAGDYGVGSLVADAMLTDLDGAAHSWRELAGTKPVVIALVSTSCPVSKRYTPTLAKLEADYRARGIAFLLVAQNQADSADDLRAALKTAGLTAPCLRDPQQAWLKALHATASTDVFVIDAAHTLVYRGAIDDQYGLGYSLEAPRHRYLAEALEATLAGRPPAIAATQAPGCALDLSDVKATASEVTYHNRISRLVQANCQECHRAGGVAPFALETYEQVTAKSGMIRKMVSRGLMPPWFAVAPDPGSHSPWGNDRSLAGRDRTDLLAWLDAGKPLGDAKDAPAPRVFPKDWQIGTPDAVVQLPSPIEIKADGTMPYQNVTVSTSFAEDRWVRGIEIQPTAREVVHHVLVFAQEPGSNGLRGRFAGEDDERGGFFAAYVPGNDHVIFPEGFAKLLPAGSKLRFQIHYTPNGTATRDQLKLAMIFAPIPPEHIIRVAGIANHRLNIPAGASHHPESAVIPIPADVKLLAFTPHMHVRGAAFRYEAVLADGTVRTLLDVPRYDFNWQLSYRYAEPPTLPAGSKIRATAWYDNSTNNPANPDPTKTVRWGPQTYDEMMLGYVEYYVPSEKPPAKTAAR